VPVRPPFSRSSFPCSQLSRSVRRRLRKRAEQCDPPGSTNQCPGNAQCSSEYTCPV
jgi:hypothetical protein